MATDRIKQTNVDWEPDGLMTEEQMRECVLYYEHITRRILPVADLDQRKATFGDFVTSSTARTLSESGNHTEASEMLLNLLEDTDNKHTVLGRVSAVIAMYDVMANGNLWGDVKLLNRVTNSFKNAVDDQDDGSAILFGALYARFMSANMDGDISNIGKVNKMIDEKQTSVKAQRFVCAIRGSRNAIMEMLTEQSLRMQFPVSTLYLKEGEQQQSGVEAITSVGYPDKMLHLGLFKGRNKIASLRKMWESVLIGAPNPERGILESRPLHFLIGVEEVQKTKSERQGIKSNIEARLHHIALPGFSEDGYNSLTYWSAITISRFLGDTFFGMTGEFSDNQEEFAQDEWVKKKIAKARIRIHLEQLREDKNGTSILKVAISEHRRLTGKEITEDQAADILYKSIAKRTFMNDASSGRNIVRLKNELVITADFVRHVWDDRLTAQDRVDFIKLSLINRDSPVWEKIPDVNVRRTLDPMIRKVIPFTEEYENMLSEIAEQDPELKYQILVARFETIRDKLGLDKFWGDLQLPSD